jgi:hypothetical protein
MRLHPAGGALAMLFAIAVYAADGADAVKSGPQVGAKITQAFEVKLCNGPDAGAMACLV